LSAVGHALVIAAFRNAQASVLSPLVYLELVTAVAIGWFLLGELPDPLAWTGLALIVSGGLAMVLTERRR
jgi:S-adenosylmethionine uptake transporter